VVIERCNKRRIQKNTRQKLSACGEQDKRGGEEKAARLGSGRTRAARKWVQIKTRRGGFVAGVGERERARYGSRNRRSTHCTQREGKGSTSRSKIESEPFNECRGEFIHKNN